MNARHVLAGFVSVAIMAAMGVQVEGAEIVPAKGYVKPGEPVAIRFFNDNEQGKKVFEKLGFEAVKLDGLFTPAPAKELVADSKPVFELYTFDGKPVEPGKVDESAVKGDGSVDMSAIFPQLKEAGTWVLRWKDANPVVIETLRNPMPWAIIMDESKVPPDQRAAAVKQLSGQEPVVTHIVPLEYIVIMTDKGVIEAKLSYDVAPHTIDNFISLADQKFYDGSAFHRIISGFMIQGGDSLGNSDTRAGTGGPGYNVGAEFSDKPHDRGVLSMARSGIDAAGSQFFIVHQKAPHLDGLYTAFGDVIEGMKVVDAIAETPAEKGSGTVKGPKPQIEKIRALAVSGEMAAKIYGIGK